VPCGLLSLQSDGRIVDVNRRMADWIGHQPADLVGRRLHEILSVPARIFYETNISPLLRMQGFVDEVAMDFIACDARKVPCLVNAAERRGEDGAVLFTDFAVFKATERRR
jgi:phosphoserine phosphatase RsbU/P